MRGHKTLLDYPDSSSINSSVGSGGIRSTGSDSYANTKGHQKLIALLISMGFMVQGTGGAFAAPTHSTTSNSSVRLGRVQSLGPVEAERSLVPAKLVSIRRSLSLNVKNLAGALQVERPTIYSWMQGKSCPHQSNLDRINALDELATEWKHMSDRPVGQLLSQRLRTGSTLLNLLNDPRAKFEELREALQELNHSAKKMTNRSGFDMRAKARALGFAEITNDIAERSLDGETTYASLPEAD